MQKSKVFGRSSCDTLAASLLSGSKSGTVAISPSQGPTSQDMAWRASLSKTVQELRIHLCQTSPGSKGARDFVANRYQELKSQNPQLPILIRECSGIQPRLFARFDHGQEKAVALEGLDEASVETKLEELVRAKAQ